MKISDQYTTSMVGADNVREKKKKELKAGQSGEAKSAVALNISGKGQEVAKARNLALAAPEVRQEMIDQIVGMIRQGAYNVTGEDVAPKMIEEHVLLLT